MAVKSKTRTRRVASDYSAPSYSSTPNSGSSNMLEKLVPILLLASVVLAFVVGMLWQKVSLLEKGGTAALGANPPVDAAPEAPSGKLTEDQAKKVPVVSAEDHVRGSRQAQIFLVEYSDLECPFCKQFHPTAQQVMKEYGDKVAWVFRHFPLEQIHPNAVPAGIASECVFNLGGDEAFWKFVDAAYAGQETSLTAAKLPDLAAGVGVNKAAFQTCFDKADRTKIDAQMKLGTEAGVTGTPANFIMNSKGEVWLIPGALPFESLKATIDEALSS